MKKYSMSLLIIIFITGCAAVGVPSTNDPKEKLYWANELIKKGRALPAEKLIGESLSICQENKDTLCLGDAYAYYAFFLRSWAVERYEEKYRERGFYLDKKITYENRFIKSEEYYKKAIDEFLKINKYDYLTNVYVELGHTYYFLKNKELECKSYDTSLMYNKKYVQENPNAKISLPKEFSTFEEYINMEKERAKCSKIKGIR